MNKLVLAIVITMTTTTVLFFQNCSNSFESQAINHNYNSSENNNDEISSISDSGTLPTFSISSKYKEDQGIKNDPDVILFSDFENDFLKDGWSSSEGDVELSDGGIDIFKGQFAHFKVTFPLVDGKVEDELYLTRKARLNFDLPVPQDDIFVRLYTYFPTETSAPHHFFGFRAAKPDLSLVPSGGSAGLKPDGDLRFQGRLDIDQGLVPFTYTYSHKMKCHESNGNCYGNSFLFPPNDLISFERNKWVCLEFMIKSNTPNIYDGEQAFWINNKLAQHYYTGSHFGQWLHNQFVLPKHEKYEAFPRDRGGFEGFNFRKNSDVKIRRLELEYYQSGWSLNKKGFAHKSVHNVYFDNVIVAKKRIGCMNTL